MKRIIYISLVSLLISCIDEINLTSGGNAPKLVVDAWISNDPSLSYVKVYYSAPFQSGNFNLDFKQPNVASIYVETENQDNIIDYMASFTHPDQPKYIPRGNIDFQTGNRYRLNILLADGNYYRSEWQEVAPKGKVMGFEYNIVQKRVFRERVNAPPSQYMQYFVDIEAVIENPAQQEYGYYMKTSGIEELMTASLSDFCQCMCYQDIPNIYDGLNYFSKSGIFTSSITTAVGSISMNRIFRYYINLDLYATSGEASQYLERISTQQRNTGSIFDPMPFNIKGNIKNVNDDSEEVLGYFFTAHHSQMNEMIRRGEIYSQNRHLNFYLDEIPVVNGNCQEVYTNAVNFPPPPFIP